MNQTAFFDGYDIREPRYDLIAARFKAFHEDNPEVWRLFVRFTFDLIRRGFKHYSSDAVVHRIRWHSAVETTGDIFKVNNNHVAMYSRMFHATYPEHDGFFRTRERKS